MGITRTPLRYPGGKAKLTSFINEVLVENKINNAHYVEPYAGGAGAGLQLLFENKVESIHLNDSSLPIYAFWFSVLNHTDALCRLVNGASLNIAEWRQRQQVVRNPQGYNLLEIGFSTLYLNRVNRSGILSGGIIGGIEQTGNYKMDARFTRTKLVEKILNIASKKNKITISNFDAEEFLILHDAIFPTNTLIYLDPPYYDKGSELYLNYYNHNDHLRLSELIQTELRSKWILSYDSVSPILDMYDNRSHFCYDLQYNASKVYKGKEIFIFSDQLSIPKNSALKFIDIALNQTL